MSTLAVATLGLISPPSVIGDATYYEFTNVSIESEEIDVYLDVELDVELDSGEIEILISSDS